MLDTIMRSIERWADPPPIWRGLRDVASVLGVATVGSGTPMERTLRDHERQVADALDVAGMARGDRTALAALYDRYAGILLGLGLRILGDRREAEDVVHDVFIEAWGAAATYDPTRGSVSTWLVLRMRSRTLDRVRSAGRSRTFVSDDPTSHGTLAAQMTADHQGVAEAMAMRSALEELPAEQRRVLELGYFGGMSSSEIAHEVGISIGTVKSRTAAGLSKLRTRLGGGR